MSSRSVRGPDRPTGGAGVPRLLPVLLAVALATGCDHPFEPFQEDALGPYSIFGYLDLHADTQWIRVMPVRHQLLPGAAPIDAVVTLEHGATGRVVTLRDSVFAFTDNRLDGEAYAHNFWTTEPLEPGATYRLEAIRSDGETTTATVEMPPELVVHIEFWEVPEVVDTWEPRQMFGQSDHLLYVDVIYTVFDPTINDLGSPVRERRQPTSFVPGVWGFALPGIGPFQRLNRPPYIDLLRREVEIVSVGEGWPYEPGLSAAEVAIPGRIPTTVQNGVGALLAVAARTIALPLCESVEARPDGTTGCDLVVDASAASIAGNVVRPGCPASDLARVRLTQRFAGGGAVVYEWRTDGGGLYRFQGLEPGSELTLELSLGGFPTGEPVSVDVPPLEPGARYIVPEVSLACDAGATPGPVPDA